MSEFYEKHYGKASSSQRIMTVAQLIIYYLHSLPARPVRMLDIGCGDGESISQAMAIVEGSGIRVKNQLAVFGWDISQRGIEKARQRGIQASVHDITNHSFSEQDGLFDVVVFSEVLEHIVDTGAAMRTIRDTLNPGGALVLTTPNLAAWYNRLLLPLGIQPFLTELSFETPRFGNRFIYRLLGEKPGENYMAGHLRIFTFRALKEFVRYFDFRIIKTIGIASHGDLLSRMISKIWTGGAGGIGMLAIRS